MVERERQGSIPKHIMTSYEVKKLKPKTWKIITGVRDPIARTVSSMYENGKKITGKEIAHSMSFFTQELQPTFGIDIYCLPFDKQLGYSIYCYKNVHVLVYKMERLSDVMKPMLKDFLELDIKEQATRRVTTDLNYAFLQAKTKYDKSALDAVYTSKYVRHFYTDAEIEMFRMLWA